MTIFDQPGTPAHYCPGYLYDDYFLFTPSLPFKYMRFHSERGIENDCCEFLFNMNWAKSFWLHWGYIDSSEDKQRYIERNKPQ